MSADGASNAAARPSPSHAHCVSPTDYDALLRRVPAILYVAEKGAKGAWTYASPQIEAILGFTPEQWCADPTLWYQRLHPDDRERVLRREMNPRIDRYGNGIDEYRMIHRDGSIVWVRDEALLIEDEHAPAVWHGVLADVTEQRAAAAEVERSAARHAAIAALGEHALEGRSAVELAQEAIDAAVALLEMDFGGVAELDAERRHFRFLASNGMPDESIAAGIEFDEGTQTGYAIAHGRTVVTDWATETRFAMTAPVRATGTRSGLTTVIEGRRSAFGVLGVHCSRPRQFTTMEIDFVQSLANVLSDAFERQLIEEDIRHRALHDPLTTLPNRTLFMDRLGQAVQRLRRRDCSAAVLFLDLDRFKLVNESLGHEIGDDLLAAAAPRLKQTVRSSDTVARLGADEFAVLLEEIGGEHDAVDMAQRIASVFTRPFVLDGTEHFVTTSIGISLAAGGERPEDLIRDAEAAMHRAKERGRARYELFDERLRGRAMIRLRVENDLRRALQREELRLDYQPIVRLSDGAIVSVEALLRWEHPERGRVPPLDFIPIAEENGLIEPIGRWVLERACRQAAAWYVERPDAAPISVAVNLSAVQFDNPSLVDAVGDALRAAGLDPGLLGLEITESVMMGQAEELTRTLDGLKALGVRLILDDFGTGYSSLAYLSRLPLDVLKVDRSFVDGLGSERRDTAIAEAIVAMSHALSLDVVGEGAENELQIAELARLGCGLVQGFYFSRPVAPARISEMLAGGLPAAVGRSVQRRRPDLQR